MRLNERNLLCGQKLFKTILVVCNRTWLMICLKKLIQEALHPIHRSVRGRLAYVTSAAFSEPVGEPSLQSLLGAKAPQAEVGHDSSRRDAIGLLALLVEKILHGVRECDNHTSGLSEIPLRCCWMTRLHKHWALGRATLLHKKSLQHYCTKKSFQHPFAEILGTPTMKMVGVPSWTVAFQRNSNGIPTEFEWEFDRIELEAEWNHFSMKFPMGLSGPP